MAVSGAVQSAERHVPEQPVAGKQVIKVDVFETAIRTVGVLQLVPLFPYVGDGDVVPCLSPTAGRPDVEPYQLFHTNEADETMLCLAAQGATVPTGVIMKLAQKHGVNSFLRDPRDPENFNVVIVTIRMKAGENLQEGISFSCPNCHETIFRRDFNVKSGPKRKHYAEFYALRHYTEAVKEYNADDANQKCASCGEVAPKYPLHLMGWWQYAENIEIADRGRDELESVAGEYLSSAS